MGSNKVCMNTSCGAATSHEWKRGWPLRSGDFAVLCFACGSAYENSAYCDTFHLKESGWRECSMCNKHLHCGCIVSESLLQSLDYGGVGCISCLRSLRVNQIQKDEIANGFGSLSLNNAGGLEFIHLRNRVASNGFNEGTLAQLCRLIEVEEANLLHHSEDANGKARLGKFCRDKILHPIAEAGMRFTDISQPSDGSSKFPTLDNIRSLLDIGSVNALSPPPLSMALGSTSTSTNFVPLVAGNVKGKEQSKSSSPFQQGPKSRPILPKPSKSGPGLVSDTNKVTLPEPRIARPPAEGRGKNQLLPRYWPRITDQELQQLSGDLNSKIVPLFEKVLSASDAGRIGRLVLPKACAEAYFPPISQSEGVPLKVQDVKGREWTFQFRFWPNNNSRMYVLEGVTPCIQAMQVQAGDTITFSRIDPGGKLVIGYRKATNNCAETQDDQTSTLNGLASGETSFPADGDAAGNNGDNSGVSANLDSLQQSVPVTEKKRTRNIGPKNKRLLMHNEDALELRLTWEEAQDLLRPPPNVKPSVVTIDDHEFEEYEEPPVFGKRTIFTVRASGRQDQWVQCDECSKWRKLPVDALLPPKWTCSDNIWDPSRCMCSASEEMNTKDMDNLFRVSIDLKKRRSVESRHKLPQECEPSGLDALANAAVLGENFGDLAEPSAGVTTKHPRHRLGCTCIVCIQPPSGKGKHKPTCTCNVCMTVKRRFKTLMLRKKKRQSERDAEVSRKDYSEHKDETHVNGSLTREVVDTKKSYTEEFQNGKQSEVAETSSGRIDLNFHPNREEMQIDVSELSMADGADNANVSLDGHATPNKITSLVGDQKTNTSSCLFSQTCGERLRQLSDEAFLASMGWDNENGGN